MQSSKSSRALQVRLLHVQTTTLIEFPKNLTVIRIGKPDSNRLPDIDVTHLPNSDIVSRSQAEIRIQENAYFIQDLASANGTFLNGSRLTPYTSCQLRYGDKIDFGKDELFTFLFREAKQPKAPISSSRSTGNNFQASASRNLRVTSRGNGERNQRESSQHSAPNFNILAFILNGLTSTFRNLASFVSRQIKRFIKWLIRTVVKIGLIFIALFVIGLLGVLLIHGLTHAPAVVGSGGAGGGMPVVEIPVEAPVE